MVEIEFATGRDADYWTGRSRDSVGADQGACEEQSAAMIPFGTVRASTAAVASAIITVASFTGPAAVA